MRSLDHSSSPEPPSDLYAPKQHLNFVGSVEMHQSSLSIPIVVYSAYYLGGHRKESGDFLDSVHVNAQLTW